MTTNAITPRVEYIEDGVNPLHTIPYRFLQGSDLRVYRIIAGVKSELDLGVDYTISGGGTTGGTLIASGGIPGATLRIDRATARTQGMDYSPNDTFPAESHEGALDRLSLITQETAVLQNDLLVRAAVAPEGETGFILPLRSARASRLPVFNNIGDLGVLDGRNVVVILDALQRPATMPVYDIMREIGVDLYEDGTWGGAFTGDDGAWG